MKTKELIYFNAFNLIPQVGPRGFIKIVQHFSSLEEAWSAPIQEYRQIGLNKKTIDSIQKKIPEILPDQEYEILARENIELIPITDENYPRALKQISDPPPVLYVRGSIMPEDDFAIGIVGSRKISSYGKIAVQEIVKQLVFQNITIVSGLAIGIDTQSHISTIENNGRTIAVLGSGLDWKNIYPSINKQLVKRIIDDHGAVISEFPIGTEPSKFNFPRRNRIISGLSKGILVIEAAERSGALITADFALDQNRDVFAVPGDIFKPNYVGTNDLIKKGAKLVTNADDILEELDMKQIKQYSSARRTVSKDPKENQILDILSKEPIHKDIILRKLDIPTPQLLGMLSMMEMKGYIKDIGNGEYIIL